MLADGCHASVSSCLPVVCPNQISGSKQLLAIAVGFILFTFLFYTIIYDRLSRKIDENLPGLIARNMLKPNQASESTADTTESLLLPVDWKLLPRTTPVPTMTVNRKYGCSDYVIFSNGFQDGRRLGNQIFNYAVGLYVAELTGRRLGINESGFSHTGALTELEKVFQLNFDRYNETCPVYHISDAMSLAYNKDFEKIIHNREEFSNKTINLSGFFQSWKYTRMEDVLRSRLVFKDDLMVYAENFLRANIPPGWNQGFFTRVGIHVRRDDVVENQEKVDFGYTTPGPSYFKRAMQHMVDMYTRVQFLVVTDDSKWVTGNLSPDLVEKKDTMTRVNVTVCKGNSAGQDLAILSLCDHTIISTGTFGWWGAWLAKGTTIYYSNWPKTGSKLDKMFRRSDYFIQVGSGWRIEQSR